MPSAFSYPNVSNFGFSSQGNSSTGIAGIAPKPLDFLLSNEGLSLALAGEVPFLSGDCRICRISPTHDASRERNESAFLSSREFELSKRKDRQKADLKALLKTPNPSPMKAFTESFRHRSFAPEEQVMDRRTEGAAGGSDAL